MENNKVINLDFEVDMVIEINNKPFKLYEMYHQGAIKVLVFRDYQDPTVIVTLHIPNL